MDNLENSDTSSPQKEQQKQANEEQEKQNQKLVPKKLNWTTVLYDENIFIDSELYRKWDRNLKFQDQALIQKDLARTRSNEEYFVKKSTRLLLKRITTFYCMSNRIHYQQGLLEVVIPFALLHRKDFQTRKCYAYFNSFMRKYFPRVLMQKTMGNKSQLPHAILALTLIQILLRYHERTIYQILKNYDIPLSMVFTQEILTVFARNVQIPLVYEIYNFYINKKDKNYMLYMAIALISMKKKQIMIHSQEDQLHTYVNKNLKSFRTQEELQEWFAKAEQVQAQTPKSFLNLSKKVGYCDRSFFTLEDYERMMKLQNWLIDYVMPVYRQQIDQNPEGYVFILLDGEVPSKGYRFIRLSITQVGGSIIYNQQQVKKISKDKILVVGYTQQREDQEKVMLGKLIKQIEIMTNFSYKFMMFQDKLKAQKSCEIY